MCIAYCLVDTGWHHALTKMLQIHIEIDQEFTTCVFGLSTWKSLEMTRRSTVKSSSKIMSCCVKLLSYSTFFLVHVSSRWDCPEGWLTSPLSIGQLTDNDSRLVNTAHWLDHPSKYRNAKCVHAISLSQYYYEQFNDNNDNDKAPR